MFLLFSDGFKAVPNLFLELFHGALFLEHVPEQARNKGKIGLELVEHKEHVPRELERIKVVKGIKTPQNRKVPGLNRC